VVKLLIALGVTVLLVGGMAALLASRGAPRNDRDWAADHARAARIELGTDLVRIGDLRDFRHVPDGRFEEGYRDETFRLDDVRAVWFVLAPFANRFRGLAHGFVSFELEGERYVAISIEARREEGEGYALLGGMLRSFEVTYVVGTEEDLVGQRAARGDTLFLYPSRATPAQARALFEDMLGRAHELHEQPEYYNTLVHNCMTMLRAHVNRIAPDPLPWGWGILLPGFSDKLALDHGLLATDLDIAGARARHRVDEVAREALGAGEAFGARIREGLSRQGGR
jgi:hypothetical protein